MSRLSDRRQAIAALVRGLAVAGTASLLAACEGLKSGQVGATSSISGGTPIATSPNKTVPVSGPVKVALLLPLSGHAQTAAVAKSIRQAAELALFEKNAADLQLLVKDDHGTEAGARTATEAALGEGAELIIGPLFSKSVAAIAPLARKAGVPIVAFSNDPSVAGPGVYLLGYTATAEVDRAVDYASGKGLKRFVALVSDDAEGRILEPAFRAAVARNGGSVVSVDRYRLDGNGLVDTVRRLQASIKDAGTNSGPSSVSGPASNQGRIDAIFFPGNQDTLPQLDSMLPQLDLDTHNVRLIGTSNWDYPSVHRLSRLTGAWFAASEPGGWREFSERFGRAYGGMPPRLASLGHDAIVMAAALSGGPIGARFTTASLTRSSGFIGADGAFRLQASGLVDRGLAVLELQKSGPVVVDVAPAAIAIAPQASIKAPVSVAPAATN